MTDDIVKRLREEGFITHMANFHANRSFFTQQPTKSNGFGMTLTDRSWHIEERVTTVIECALNETKQGVRSASGLP